jgi:hypothetical protein
VERIASRSRRSPLPLFAAARIRGVSGFPHRLDGKFPRKTSAFTWMDGETGADYGLSASKILFSIPSTASKGRMWRNYSMGNEAEVQWYNQFFMIAKLKNNRQDLTWNSTPKVQIFTCFANTRKTYFRR